MARYVDAEKLKDSLRESYKALFKIYQGLTDDVARKICEGQLNTFTECIIRATTQATENVVEIKCRCKDCKYWRNGYCNGIPFCGDDASYVETEENDFCSYGERRTDNEL